MIIFLIFLLLIIVATNFLILKTSVHGKFWNHLRLISSIVFIFTIIVGSGIYASYKPRIIEYNNFKNSVEDLKKQEEGLRSTFISMKIIEINESILKAKYWNETVFGLFVSDEYAGLELIKFGKEKKIKIMEKSL
jgi:hypothetical protein